MSEWWGEGEIERRLSEHIEKAREQMMKEKGWRQVALPPRIYGLRPSRRSHGFYATSFRPKA
jgi:hypothetical protein